MAGPTGPDPQANIHELFEPAGGIAAGGQPGDRFRFIVPICRAWLALSRRQPLVLALDDLQWADPASLDVLGYLMRMIDSEPLMLLAVIRTEEAESGDHRVRAWLAELAMRRTYTTVRLQRLAESDCREIIGRIFGIRRRGEVPRDDVESLYGLTGGNPYFLVETLRHLVAVGAIAPDDATRCWRERRARPVAAGDASHRGSREGRPPAGRRAGDARARVGPRGGVPRHDALQHHRRNGCGRGRDPERRGA